VCSPRWPWSSWAGSSAGSVIAGDTTGKQQAIEQGDARDVATLEKVLIDRDEEGNESLRIRTCGRDPVGEIFPNLAALEAFHHRTASVKPGHPILSMEGKLGSYLLQELAIWVCGQVGERSFPHDDWVMAAVCEPATFEGHRSTTIILIRRDDLTRFRDWTKCRDIRVEHGGHGERILTLLSVAEEFDRQAALVAKRQAAGQRPGFEETMYLLDLALDRNVHDLPTKPVPWNRFEATLKARGLE